MPYDDLLNHALYEILTKYTDNIHANVLDYRKTSYYTTLSLLEKAYLIVELDRLVFNDINFLLEAYKKDMNLAIAFKQHFSKKNR